MVEMTLQDALNRLRFDESQLESLNQQLQSTALALEEIRRTRVTLENLPDEEASGLMPLGGVLIPFKADASIVKLNVGSSNFVDTTRKEAVSTLMKREKELEEIIRQLQKNVGVVRKEAVQIKQKLKEKFSKQQEPNVLS